MDIIEKAKAPRNRTLTISARERVALKKGICFSDGGELSVSRIMNKTICGDLFEVLDLLPLGFVDLMIIDPPYNLAKDFHGFKFLKTD
ncbi:MAG: hypothetical protein LBK06_05505, partial [Planctomycetaceae bacterium]|nr:hypothetical protein [Planctomycetaceae bacterium]